VPLASFSDYLDFFDFVLYDFGFGKGLTVQGVQRLHCGSGLGPPCHVYNFDAGGLTLLALTWSPGRCQTWWRLLWWLLQTTTWCSALLCSLRFNFAGLWEAGFSGKSATAAVGPHVTKPPDLQRPRCAPGVPLAASLLAAGHDF